jgi:hypothetical protein
MRRTLMGVSLICPYCHQPVDPTKPNAMMRAATKELQHKDCWTGVKDAGDGESEPKSPSRTA